MYIEFLLPEHPLIPSLPFSIPLTDLEGWSIGTTPMCVAFIWPNIEGGTEKSVVWVLVPWTPSYTVT